MTSRLPHVNFVTFFDMMMHMAYTWHTHDTLYLALRSVKISGYVIYGLHFEHLIIIIYDFYSF